jgi:hypothetical protein
MGGVGRFLLPAYAEQAYAQPITVMLNWRHLLKR